MGALERLRALDDRLISGPQLSPERWRRRAARWWVVLVVAVLYAAIGILVVIVPMPGAGPRFVMLAVSVPAAIGFAFIAGLQKAEHDRLTGRDPLSRRRPAGL